jgi:hypothetical protein
MSSISFNKRRIEAWLLLVACLGMTIWYAKPQIFYSLSFLYYLGRALLPGLVPNLKE